MEVDSANNNENNNNNNNKSSVTPFSINDILSGNRKSPETKLNLEDTAIDDPDHEDIMELNVVSDSSDENEEKAIDMRKISAISGFTKGT